MEVTIDHFTLKTNQFNATKQFFKNLFGFEDIVRPQALKEIPGCWLGNNEKAIVHLISVGDAPSTVTNGVDHIGLLMPNQAQFLSRLKAQKITPIVINCQKKNGSIFM